MKLEQKVAAFEEHRPQLKGLAYRMLGTHVDAEDVVQETYLRWERCESEKVRTPRAWLTKVCTRIALDELKSARSRREEYYGPWLPEPYLFDESRSPASRAEIDDSVSLALLLALENLSAVERAAFLLHDVFGYSFEAVGEILGKTESACRKLASRARRGIQFGKPRFEATPDDHKRLLESFLRAAQLGDMEGLKTMLSESVEFHSDGGGKASAAAKVLTGVETVALFVTKIAASYRKKNSAFNVDYQWFNGAPGLLIYENDVLITAFSLRPEQGKIAAIYAHRNPDKLAAFDKS